MVYPVMGRCTQGKRLEMRNCRHIGSENLRALLESPMGGINGMNNQSAKDFLFTLSVSLGDVRRLALVAVPDS